MTNKYCKMFVVLFVSVAVSACSIIAHDYTYIANKSNGWSENNNTYTYNCGKYAYSVYPGKAFEPLWVSPLPIFPYIFPAYLLEKNTNMQLSGVRINRSIGEESNKELENVTPIIKLDDNRVIRPSRCAKWIQYNKKEGIEAYSECSYNVLVWDVSSYTLLFEEDATNTICKLPPLEFKQQIHKFYMACPPHCPKIYID